MTEIESTDVAIIGAGVAGLVAADELAKAGVNAVILESARRIGGRIQTDEEGIERGAEMVHGEQAREYVEQWTKLEEVTDADGTVYVVHNGQMMTEQESGGDTVLEKFQQWIADLDPAYQKAASLEVAFTEKQDLLGQHRQRLWQLFTAEYGTDLSAISIWGGREGSTFNRSRYFCPSGYSAFPEALAAGRDVRLNTHVHRMCQEKRNVHISYGMGHEIVAKSAIVTLPVALLQRNAISFDPVLSRSMHSAIQQIGMGVTAKVVCQCGEIFWNDDMIEAHTGNPNTPIIYPLDTEQPTLVCYLGGEAAQQVSATFDWYSKIADGIATAFPDSRRHLRKMEVINWSRNPATLGSYTFVRPGAYDARTRLMQPEGNILFAGEAATDSLEAGTVGGAIESGQRAARQALALL